MKGSEMLHIHVHHHYDNDIKTFLTQLEKRIMAAIDDLQAAVAQEDTVIGSAITLINGIPALIAAAGTDPTKLQALTADITAKAQALSQAVVANTPAQSAPTS